MWNGVAITGYSLGGPGGSHRECAVKTHGWILPAAYVKQARLSENVPLKPQHWTRTAHPSPPHHLPVIFTSHHVNCSAHMERSDFLKKRVSWATDRGLVSGHPDLTATVRVGFPPRWSPDPKDRTQREMLQLRLRIHIHQGEVVIASRNQLTELAPLLALHPDTLVHDTGIVAKALDAEVTLPSDPGHYRDQVEHL